MMRVVLFLLITIAPVAHAQEALPAQKPTLTEADFKLVSRCSNAARLAVGAAEAVPENQRSRHMFIHETLKRLNASKQLGDTTPSVSEAVSAQASMETLLQNGQKPGSSAQMHDFFIAQTAATCVLTAKSSK